MNPFDYLAYIWQVECSDGKTLTQFDNSGEHRLSEIPIESITKFTWIPTREGLELHSILVLPGQKLNCYRKNFLSMISGDHKVAFVIGVEGQTPKWIFEDEILMEDLK